MIKTENGGSSWSVVNLATTNTLYFMTGFTENVYLGGAGGSLYSNVVLPSTIEVVYPNGGEVFTERTTINIEWEASNFEGDVVINLLNNDVLNEEIGVTSSSDGIFEWLIPESLIEDSTYTIEIYSVDDRTIHDESDSEFTIRPQRNTVSVSSNPIEGGSIEGAGEYIFGENVILTAVPADSYNFINWTSDDIELGTVPTLEFTIDRDTSIIANFVFDDSPAQITVSFPDTISDTVGAEIDIPVFLEFSKSTAFEAFEFELNYNPSIINIQSIVLDSSVIESFDTLSNRNQVGKIHFTGASSEVVSSEGLFLTLRTVSNQVGNTNLEWSDFFFNEGEPIANPINGFVEVVDIPRNCGDVTNDGFVTNEDATWILRHGVKLSPQFPLIGEDSLAADVTANGWISAFDAAQVLKDVVGLNRNFNCDEPLRSKSDPLIATWNWSVAQEGSAIIIPIDIEINSGELQALGLEVTIPSGFSYSGIENKNSDWFEITNQKEGKLYLSMIGTGVQDKASLGALKFQGNGDTNQFSAIVQLNEQTTLSLTNEFMPEKPASFILHQNYPNPFNPTTTISYSIPIQGLVQLSIYNTLGQQVAVLENGVKQSGTHNVRWDASNQASGIYVYKITFGNTVLTKKLMLIK
ncbi:MAG: T9SS type A sorting domain-containing protein [Balneola sp.]